MRSVINEEKPVLGILLGDAAGIGPEIIAKAAAQGVLEACCKPLIIGDLRVLKQGMKTAGVEFPFNLIDGAGSADWSKGIQVLDQKNLDPDTVKIGEVDPNVGKITGEMLVTAINLFKEGKIEGFCFAPLNKAAMKAGGFKFESEHTLFAHYFNCTEPSGEINVLDNISTSRVTSHIPIKDVSKHLTKDAIVGAIKLLHDTLKRTGMENARIAIAALNPHAGENGTCGTEEIDVIKPALEEAKLVGINVAGPFSSDILFIKVFNGEFDAAVTMYHDQGQIAMKLKGFEKGVTLAAGFPAPIATPAHGTAYDIAGKGIARITAFENALKMTAKIALYNRKNKK